MGNAAGVSFSPLLVGGERPPSPSSFILIHVASSFHLSHSHHSQKHDPSVYQDARRRATGWRPPEGHTRAARHRHRRRRVVVGMLARWHSRTHPSHMALTRALLARCNPLISMCTCMCTSSEHSESDIHTHARAGSSLSHATLNASTLITGVGCPRVLREGCAARSLLSTLPRNVHVLRLALRYDDPRMTLTLNMLMPMVLLAPVGALQCVTRMTRMSLLGAYQLDGPLGAARCVHECVPGIPCRIHAHIRPPAGHAGDLPSHHRACHSSCGDGWLRGDHGVQHGAAAESSKQRAEGHGF